MSYELSPGRFVWANQGSYECGWSHNKCDHATAPTQTPCICSTCSYSPSALSGCRRWHCPRSMMQRCAGQHLHRLGIHKQHAGLLEQFGLPFLPHKPAASTVPGVTKYQRHPPGTASDKFSCLVMYTEAILSKHMFSANDKNP